MMLRQTLFALPAFTLIVSVCNSWVWADDAPAWLAYGANGMVAADCPAASRAGLAMLQQGGNAVDAACAVSFVLSVTRPESTGLGGGGFMLIRMADGTTTVLDYRETAPGGCVPEMFANVARSASPRSPPASRFGPLAVAVPGVPAGWSQAISRHGTLPVNRLLEPARQLAQDGFAVDSYFVQAARDVLETYQRYPVLKLSGAYVYERFLGYGKLPEAGSRLRQPELAHLLGLMADKGLEIFYQGQVAADIADTISGSGGLLAQSDLEQYRVIERTPLRSQYRDYEILAIPPPSSGGVAIVETLNILSVLGTRFAPVEGIELRTHLRVEAMKHAFADRARFAADPAFARVPVDLLTSNQHARELAARVSSDRPAQVDGYGALHLPDDAGTSHFCVVDRAGNVVVATESINTTFGSLFAVSRYGLILNNHMDDFTAIPGEPNAFGLTQSARNAPAPGKRPVSSMAPTLVLRDGRVHLAIGASGGPRIISSVLHVVLGVVEDDLSLQAAMLQPRPHHQWMPDEIFFDAEPPEPLAAALRAKGHRLAERRATGVVQAILREADGWRGASDPRKGGQPAGY